MDEVMYLPNDVFLPLVLDELRQNPGKTATINLRGRSIDRKSTRLNSSHLA